MPIGLTDQKIYDIARETACVTVIVNAAVSVGVSEGLAALDNIDRHKPLRLAPKLGKAADVQGEDVTTEHIASSATTDRHWQRLERAELHWSELEDGHVN